MSETKAPYGNMGSVEERRDARFHRHTVETLQHIHDAENNPDIERYPYAYGTLYGYVEMLLTNFAEAFNEMQLGEIRIVLDQLRAFVGEDGHLDEAKRRQLSRLAEILRIGDDEPQRH